MEALNITPRESRIQHWISLCWTGVYIAPFGAFFALAFSSVVTQNQIIDLTCSVIFAYNQTQCDQLGKPNPSEEAQTIETTIQPYVSKILTVMGIATTIGPAITGAFFGAWSDKFGRKALLRLSLIGFFFGHALWAGFTLLSKIISLSPWFYILTVVPSTFVGSYCSLLTGTYCIISDTTTEKARPLKLTILDAYIAVAQFLGSLASGYVFEATNALFVFTISTLVLFFTIIYLQLGVRESLPPEKMQKTSKIKGLFQIDLVKDMVQTFIQQRPNYARLVIWTSVGVLSTSVLTLEGTRTVFYLYVREQFAWTTKDFTTYNAVALLYTAGGAAISLVILQKVFKFSPVSVILVGLGSLAVDAVVKALATYSWHLYFGIYLCVAKGVALPTIRSLIATVTPLEETGRMYAVMAVFEFTIPIFGDPLYSFVYNATLGVYTGFFNIITVFIYLINYFIFSVLFAMQVQQPRITSGAHRISNAN